MEPAPEQVAIEEQAAREAAFARARRKLAAVRQANAAGRVDSTLGLYGSRLARSLGVASIAAFLTFLVWQVGKFPARLEDWTGPAMAVLLWTWALWMAGSTLRKIRGGPATVAAEFYRRASSGGNVSNLHQLVIEADFDNKPRRAPEFAGTPPVAVRRWRSFRPFMSHAAREQPADGSKVRQAEELPRLLEHYWKRVLTDVHGRPLAVRARGPHLLVLAPDLAVVRLRLRVTDTPRWLSAVATAAQWFSLATMGVWAFGWIGGMTVMVVAASIALVLLGLRLAVNLLRGRNMHVQKLVARAGERWRMFSGDWEGMEEADLSWLDQPTPSPEHPRSG